MSAIQGKMRTIPGIKFIEPELSRKRSICVASTYMAKYVLLKKKIKLTPRSEDIFILKTDKMNLDSIVLFLHM